MRKYLVVVATLAALAWIGLRAMGTQQKVEGVQESDSPELAAEPTTPQLGGNQEESGTITPTNSQEARERTPVVENSPDTFPPEPAKPPTKSIRILVLDSDGAPAFPVPVSLRIQRPFREPVDLETAITDEDGVANLSVEKLNKRLERGKLIGSEPKVTAIADLPHVEILSIPIDPTSSLDTQHFIHLPPMGTVTVHVQDQEGNPVTEATKLHARWIPTLEVGTAVYGGYNRCHDAKRKTDNGTSVYKYVGNDISMSITATLDGLRPGSARDVPIQIRANANQDVTVLLGAVYPVVLCKVFGVDGQPVINEKLSGSIRYPQESGKSRLWSYDFPVKTDSQGIGHFFHKYESKADYPRQLYVTRTTPGLKTHRDPLWSRGDVLLPSEISTDTPNELAEIRLVEPTILQEGYVRTEQGEGKGSVRLSFSEPQEKDSHKRPTSFGVCYSDRSGHFVFRKFEWPLRMQVDLIGNAKIDGRNVRAYGTYKELVLGDRTANFVVKPSAPARPTGSLALSALFDEDIGGYYFEFHLVRDSPSEETHTTPLFAISDQPIPLAKLTPGTWTASVRVRGVPNPLLEIRDLNVRADEVLQDARLLPLDLRGFTHLANWQVQSPSGAPWRRKSLQIRISGMDMLDKVRTNQEGLLKLAFPKHIDRVELSLKGKIWTPAGIGDTEPIIIREKE